MLSLQQEFLSYIPKGGTILDLGCGSGRDSKAFIEQGYAVEAVDGSQEMCKVASEYIGQKVICARFQDYKPNKLFDGVWAFLLPVTPRKRAIRDGFAPNILRSSQRWLFLCIL